MSNSSAVMSFSAWPSAVSGATKICNGAGIANCRPASAASSVGSRTATEIQPSCAAKGTRPCSERNRAFSPAGKGSSKANPSGASGTSQAADSASASTCSGTSPRRVRAAGRRVLVSAPTCLARSTSAGVRVARASNISTSRSSPDAPCLSADAPTQPSGHYSWETGLPVGESSTAQPKIIQECAHQALGPKQKKKCQEQATTYPHQSNQLSTTVFGTCGT